MTVTALFKDYLFILLISEFVGLAVLFFVYAFPWKKVYFSIRNKIIRIRQPFIWPRVTQESSKKINIYCGWAGIMPWQAKSFTVSIICVSLGLTTITQSIQPVLFGCAVLLGALYVCMRRVSKSKRVFIGQLPDTLDALAQTMRAGYTLMPALQIIAQETTDTIQKVFTAIVQSHLYHIHFEKALFALDRELAVPEWNMIATTLHIQQKLGGNAVPLLLDVANVIREKSRIEAEVSSATSAGRMSGFIIAFLAPFSFLLFFYLSPEYMSIMTVTLTGQVLLCIAALLEIIGFSIIWKLVQVEY